MNSVVCTFTNEPIIPDLEKTVRDGYPKHLANGNWEIVYDVVVSLPEGAELSAKYDLTDELKFGGGIDIESASWEVEGTATGGEFTGKTAQMATNKRITPDDSPHVYTVTAEAKVGQAAFGTTTSCEEAGSFEAGGFLNVAQMISGETTVKDDACVAPDEPTISKVGKSASDNGDGTWDIAYRVLVTNASDKDLYVSVTDAPEDLPEGIDLVGSWEAAAVTVGAPLDSDSWQPGNDPWLIVDNKQISADSSWEYIISATVKVESRDDYEDGTCSDLSV